jgi:putative heme-binding domain-containing protein
MSLRLVQDKDPSVRQAAVISAGLHRQAAAVGDLCRLVTSDLPQIRREAATALGRIGERRAAPSILDSIRAGCDRYLEHALIFALIRIGDREAMAAALKDPSGAARRAALIALDQMEGGNLTQDLVTPLLDPADPLLQQTAFRIIASKPAWAREILGLVREWLAVEKLDEARAESLRGVVVAFAKDPGFQDLAAMALRQEKTPATTRLLVLESMARAQLERPPATWLAEARWSLESTDGRIVRQAVATLRAAGTGEFDEALLRIARDGARPAELRVEALAAVTLRLARLEGALFQFLLGSLDREKPPLLRLSAAEALGRAPLEDGQLDALSKAVATAGPLEMPRLVGVYERSRNAATGKRLLAALEGAPGFASVSSEALRRVLRNQPDEVKKQADPLLKRLDVDTEQQKARLAELEPALKGGDAGRGREVFLGRKAGCTACHTVAGQGAKVGPDLSKIGSIRSGRDLLEAVVFPSATFARGFESFLIRTKEGAILDGMIARETADSIYLFTADRVEKRVARASVEEIRQSRLSVMPQGMDAQLSRDELKDLVAFLLSLK